MYKIDRISPSPSGAFNPHYSHSLNSISAITPLSTRTFTLSSSRSLKNLKNTRSHHQISTRQQPFIPPTIQPQRSTKHSPRPSPPGGGVTRGTSTQFHQSSVNRQSNHTLRPQHPFQGWGAKRGFTTQSTNTPNPTKTFVQSQRSDPDNRTNFPPTIALRAGGPQGDSTLQPDQQVEPETPPFIRQSHRHIILYPSDVPSHRRSPSPTTSDPSRSRWPSSRHPQTRSTDAPIWRSPSIQRPEQPPSQHSQGGGCPEVVPSPTLTTNRQNKDTHHPITAPPFGPPSAEGRRSLTPRRDPISAAFSTWPRPLLRAAIDSVSKYYPRGLLLPTSVPNWDTLFCSSPILHIRTPRHDSVSQAPFSIGRSIPGTPLSRVSQ